MGAESLKKKKVIFPVVNRMVSHLLQFNIHNEKNNFIVTLNTF